jgi:hypothetical protein
MRAGGPRAQGGMNRRRRRQTIGSRCRAPDKDAGVHQRSHVSLEIGREGAVADQDAGLGIRGPGFAREVRGADKRATRPTTTSSVECTMPLWSRWSAGQCPPVDT